MLFQYFGIFRLFQNLIKRHSKLVEKTKDIQSTNETDEVYNELINPLTGEDVTHVFSYISIGKIIENR